VVEAFFDTVTKTSRKEAGPYDARHFRRRESAPARMGRNPQTGEAIKIAASKKFPLSARRSRPRKP